MHHVSCFNKRGANLAKIFITGSADGLGRLTAESLVKQGHQVVLHARNKERAIEALKQVPKAQTVLIADLGARDSSQYEWGTPSSGVGLGSDLR